MTDVRSVTESLPGLTAGSVTDAMAAGGEEARRAFEAMMTMTKIDVAAIEAARHG